MIQNLIKCASLVLAGRILQRAQCPQENIAWKRATITIRFRDMRQN